MAKRAGRIFAKMIWPANRSLIILPARPNRDAAEDAALRGDETRPSSLVYRYFDAVASIRSTTETQSPRGVRLLICLTLMMAMVAPGCVRRRMLVRSQPDGATVYVDDQEIGITPVSVEFTYYGTRKIQLIKDGYETLTVKQAFFPPWYQFPVMEFISETLSPWEHRDEHVLDFQMEPQQILPADRLLERAQALRTNAGYGFSPALPPGTQPPFSGAVPSSVAPGSYPAPPAVLPLPGSLPAGP